MKLDLRFVEACQKTEIALDGVIEALGREPPVPPPNPKTIVTYQGGIVKEYLIEGELGKNSILNRTDAVKVEIGIAVTSIGEYAFDSCFGLTSVTIPDSVMNIGDYAFFNCSGLMSAMIPNGVTSIGNDVFACCSNLTSITIPDSVTSIGDTAFYYCTKLTSITIPNSMTSIGNYAFEECSKLSLIICQATVAPTVQSVTFGNNSSTYTGYLTRGSNVLKVPQGATGYDTSYWADPLQDSTKCGFHIEYL